MMASIPQEDGGKWRREEPAGVDSVLRKCPCEPESTDQSRRRGQSDMGSLSKSQFPFGSSLKLIKLADLTPFNILNILLKPLAST